MRKSVYFLFKLHHFLPTNKLNLSSLCSLKKYLNHTCNLKTWEAEVKGWGLRVSMNWIVRAHQKKFRKTVCIMYPALCICSTLLTKKEIYLICLYNYTLLHISYIIYTDILYLNYIIIYLEYKYIENMYNT